MNDAIAKRLLPCPAFKDRFIVIATIGSMQMPWARLRPSPRFPWLPRRRVRPPQRRGDPPHGRARAGALAGRHGVPGPPERRGGRRRRVRMGGAAAGGGEGGALDAQPPGAALAGGGCLARGGGGGGGCRALGPGRGPRHGRRASRARHAGRGSPPVRGPRRRRGQWHCRANSARRVGCAPRG